MGGVHIRILDSMFPSLPSRHYSMQQHMHGQKRSFGILKNVTDPGIFFYLAFSHKMIEEGHYSQQSYS